MDVSENNGTPKSSILIGFSIINHSYWGTPSFGNTHVVTVVFTPTSLPPELQGCQPTCWNCLFPPRAPFQWSCCHQSRPIATTPRHAGAWRPVVYPSTFPQVRFLRKRWGVKVKLCLGEEVWRMFCWFFECEIYIFEQHWISKGSK